MKDYLLANGIPEAEITLSVITTTRRLHQEIVPGAAGSPGSPAAAPTVITTDKVEMFTLTQSISITSTDMKKVPMVWDGGRESSGVMGARRPRSVVVPNPKLRLKQLQQS